MIEKIRASEQTNRMREPPGEDITLQFQYYLRKALKACGKSAQVIPFQETKNQPKWSLQKQENYIDSDVNKHKN